MSINEKVQSLLSEDGRLIDMPEDMFSGQPVTIREIKKGRFYFLGSSKLEFNQYEDTTRNGQKESEAEDIWEYSLNQKIAGKVIQTEKGFVIKSKETDRVEEIEGNDMDAMVRQVVSILSHEGLV